MRIGQIEDLSHQVVDFLLQQIFEKLRTADGVICQAFHFKIAKRLDTKSVAKYRTFRIRNVGANF